jgi:uncharacterized protein
LKKISTNNSSLAIPESDYLYLEPSQIMGSGQGLRTAIAIFKDEYFAQFEGELLTQKQANERAEAGQNGYFISLLNGKILDSKNTPCFAKFANDAEGLIKSDFKNNSKITLNQQNKVCLMATKKIKAGEEIFCSYGKKYWEGFKKQNSI